ELEGDAELRITGMERLDAAQPGQITFIGEQKYAGEWATTHASAALVTRGVDVHNIAGRALIFVDNADLAMAQVLEMFAPEAVLPPAGVHPEAAVDPSAQIGQGARIGPGCVVGANARIGERVVLHANVTVMAESVIGEDSVLWPGVVVRERCAIGKRCIL